MTRVSIGITTYNDARYLDEAVASASQSQGNVEVIISDDGSSDPATIAALDRLAASEITVLRNPHGGVSANRNHALAAMTGDYGVWLDSDDRLLPGYIAQAAAVLDAKPEVGIVVPDMRWIDRPQVLFRGEFSLGRQLLGNRLVNVSMFRVAAAREVGGFDEELPHHEDYDLWLSLLSRDWQVHLLGTPGFERRAHPGQLSHSMTSVTNPPVFAHIMSRHQDLYLAHGEDFWREILRERDMLAHYKRRYGKLEDSLHWLAARLRRRSKS